MRASISLLDFGIGQEPIPPPVPWQELLAGARLRAGAAPAVSDRFRRPAGGHGSLLPAPAWTVGGDAAEASCVEHIPVLAHDPAESGELAVQLTPLEIGVGTEILNAVFVSDSLGSFATNFAT